MSRKPQSDWLWTVPAFHKPKEPRRPEMWGKWSVTRNLLLTRSSKYSHQTSQPWPCPLLLDHYFKSTSSLLFDTWIMPIDRTMGTFPFFSGQMEKKEKCLRVITDWNFNMGQYYDVAVKKRQAALITGCTHWRFLSKARKVIVSLALWMGPDHSRINGLNFQARTVRVLLTNVNTFPEESY